MGSVRRPPAGEPSQAPYYVHLKTGLVQTEAPPEVLAELASDDDADRDNTIEHWREEKAEKEAEEDALDETAERDDYFPSDSGPASPASSSGPPRFRRIVLGTGNVMPLRMARDIL